MKSASVDFIKETPGIQSATVDVILCPQFLSLFVIEVPFARLEPESQMK